MNFDHAQHGIASDAAAVNAIVDAQPNLTPTEPAFMRLCLLRYGMDWLGGQACECENAR